MIQKSIKGELCKLMDNFGEKEGIILEKKGDFFLKEDNVMYTVG